MARSKLTTFHYFSSLPTEIRLQIWILALLEQPEPRCFTFDKRVWKLLNRQLIDEIFNAPYSVQDWDNLFLKLQLDKLGLIRVKIPLAHVNCEAREISLKWASSKSNSLGLRHIALGTQALRQSFARLALPTQDIFFVPLYVWRALCLQLRKSVELNRGLIAFASKIERLAVPAFVLRKRVDVMDIVWLIESCFASIKELTILFPSCLIMGAPSFPMTIKKFQQYWKLTYPDPEDLSDEGSFGDWFRNVIGPLQNVAYFAKIDLRIAILRARKTNLRQTLITDYFEVIGSNIES